MPLKLKCSRVVQHVKVYEMTSTMPWNRRKRIRPIKIRKAGPSSAKPEQRVRWVGAFHDI